jgi:uncharacterized protein (DUF1499 family)
VLTIRSALAILAALLALAAAALAAGGGVGYRLGWWSLPTGFQLVRWSVYPAGGAVLLGALAFGLPPYAGGLGWRGLAFLSVLLGLAAAWFPLSAERTAVSVPPIHDISTDTDDPPRFAAVIALRAGARNPPDYDGPETARQQRAAYPDIAPLLLAHSPAEAFARAQRAAQAMGWTIVAANAEEGRIEAVAETRWWRLRDDVVVRVRAAGGGARVDIRSKSRIGRSDLGANAARVRAFSERLRAL